MKSINIYAKSIKSIPCDAANNSVYWSENSIFNDALFGNKSKALPFAFKTTGSMKLPVFGGAGVGGQY